MKKLNTIMILMSAVFLANCATGKITRANAGGQQVVHVAIQGVNLFNTAPSKGKLFHTANASLEQCSKWLAQEGVNQFDTTNNSSKAMAISSYQMQMAEYNQLNDSILYQGPFSTYSTTRSEGCEGIGAK